jgi:hypothetical protein
MCCQKLAIAAKTYFLDGAENSNKNLIVIRPSILIVKNLTII